MPQIIFKVLFLSSDFSLKKWIVLLKVESDKHKRSFEDVVSETYANFIEECEKTFQKERLVSLLKRLVSQEFLGFKRLVILKRSVFVTVLEKLDVKEKKELVQIVIHQLTKESEIINERYSYLDNKLDYFSKNLSSLDYNDQRHVIPTFEDLNHRLSVVKSLASLFRLLQQAFKRNTNPSWYEQTGNWWFQTQTAEIMIAGWQSEFGKKVSKLTGVSRQLKEQNLLAQVTEFQQKQHEEQDIFAFLQNSGVNLQKSNEIYHHLGIYDLRRIAELGISEVGNLKEFILSNGEPVYVRGDRPQQTIRKLKEHLTQHEYTHHE